MNLRRSIYQSHRHIGQRNTMCNTAPYRIIEKFIYYNAPGYALFLLQGLIKLFKPIKENNGATDT